MQTKYSVSWYKNSVYVQTNSVRQNNSSGCPPTPPFPTPTFPVVEGVLMTTPSPRVSEPLGSPGTLHNGPAVLVVVGARGGVRMFQSSRPDPGPSDTTLFERSPETTYHFNPLVTSGCVNNVSTPLTRGLSPYPNGFSGCLDFVGGAEGPNNEGR